MSTKANPTVIGGFVVGAAVLAVAGLTYFGGGEFLAKKFAFVGYFDGSLKGLNIGAPVTFRGVKIGAVTNVVVRYDSADQSIRIPVYFELEQGRVEAVRERASDPYQNIHALIEDGLRAQLVTQSFVTGQIAVQLDFHPNRPAKFVGSDPAYVEFPTIPSTTAKMGKALDDFDLAALLADVSSAMQGIDELAHSSKLRDAIASLDDAIKNIGQLAQHIDAKVDTLATVIDETGEAAQRALDQVTKTVASVEDTVNPAIGDARELIQHVDGQIDSVVGSFETAVGAATATLEKIEETLTTVDGVISKDSELHYSLVRALTELSDAARSIRVLADYLAQHPEALLKGKGAPGGP